MTIQLTPTATRPVPRDRVAAPAAVLYLARGGMIDGSARQLLYLLRHLDRSRFAPTVVLDIDGPLTATVRELGIDVRVTPMRPWRSLRGVPFRGFDARAILAIARAAGVAIVHCSDTWRTRYAEFVARRMGVPLVVHVRGPVAPRDLAKNACLEADAIVAIAERYRADIVSAGYPAERTLVVNDAVDGEQYRRDPIAGARFRDEHGGGRALVVGLVGRIEPFKRVVEFVDAAALVPADVDATFVLIGAVAREPYVAEVERRIAACALADRVRFAGRRDDVAGVLSGLDLLVTMSGGSVMFEAQACGVPVLSARVDGRHSQHTRHGDTGWCVTTDAAAPVAEAIATLLRDETVRRRIGDAGHRYVCEHLAPATLARQTEAIYEGVLSASPAGR